MCLIVEPCFTVLAAPGLEVIRVSSTQARVVRGVIGKVV